MSYDTGTVKALQRRLEELGKYVPVEKRKKAVQEVVQEPSPVPV